jgi:ubiquinone/menaquinone biosynthesis C-methylase UbiE
MSALIADHNTGIGINYRRVVVSGERHRSPRASYDSRTTSILRRVNAAGEVHAANARTWSVRDVRLEQAAARDWAPAAGSVWLDAAQIWRHMSQNTNHPRAAQQIDWAALCPPTATVLDLGCGSGWLTAMISRVPHVARVIAWDSSPRLLTDVLPGMIELRDGDPGKIEPVCGEFTPLLLADASIDVVVMGSAFHHCSEPEALLADLRRVLKPAGAAVLANETPWRTLGMVWFDLRMLVAHASRMLIGRGPRCAGHVADDHVLYDPMLGDRAYTMRSWRSLMQRTGWRIDVQETGLTPYPASFRRPSPFEPALTHFLLRPA